VTRVEAPPLELSLSPGDYRYRIVLYNVLRKPEAELPWQDFTVLRAEIPRLAASEPRLLFLEDSSAELRLRGEDLVQGATVTLVREDGEARSLLGTVTAFDGSSSVAASFALESLAEGLYSLELRNPGGLAATLPAAVLLRRKLPEPGALEPAPGAAYGPKELRGMKSLAFSWEAVPEATEYRFRLWRAETPDRPIREESLTEPSFLLDELAALDKGEFLWSVEARGTDAERGPIPAVGAAQAGFRIDLPALAAPAMAAGDTFYGW
jgi:hypothetical protein